MKDQDGVTDHHSDSAKMRGGGVFGMEGVAALWRQPVLWGGVGVASCALAAALHWGGAGQPMAAGGLAGLGLAAMLGGAWGLGRGRGNPVADLLLDAAEVSPGARLITTVEGDFVYANPAFHRLFAMAVSLESIAAIVEGGDEVHHAFKRLRASAAGGVADRAEIPVRLSPAESVEWRRIEVMPLRNNRRFVLWRAEDVTPERELESARRREEERLADFLDHLPAGFFSSDAEGRLLFVNQTLADWLGLSPRDLADKRLLFSDFVVRAHDAEGDNDGDVLLQPTDGDAFKACLIQSAEEDEEGDLAYSRSLVLRNVVWRKRDDRTGASPARKLHWLFDEAPVGIVLLDLDGNVTDCNRAFLKMIGLHRDVVVGRPFTERINKEDRSETLTQVSKVVMGTMRAATLDVRMPSIGERELVSSLYASRVEDEDGEVSGLVLHFIDTTEQKDLEVQFAQSQKMQAVGQLAGGVAHDFNNLLTAMIGFCDLLLERHGPGDPSFADIMQIKQNANRATNLVRQMLAFSRKQTMKPVVLDVTAALSDLSNLLGRLIGENIELDMAQEDGLYTVRADPGQFDQVIVNLAVNARDAMPGGGTLGVHTSNVTLEAPVERGAERMPAGDYVLVEVSDTGHGIAKENLARIFDPFFTTKGPGAGTGLGLSTVYGIVRQTEGFIFVDSAMGEGTTFSIYLPRVEEEREEEEGLEEAAEGASAPRKPPAADLTGVGTILLVEDEDAVRMFGARALRNKGYEVMEATNGEEALDVINQADRAPDLIVSDVVMPGMDGHTLVQLVRQEFPEVKIILMSGYAEDALSENIQNDPTVNFLGKPFTLKELATTVKKVLGA